jgi:hypothetical protein
MKDTLMSKRRTAAIVAASLFGMAGSAVAGTTDAFTITTPVARTLSDPVTYSTPQSGKKPPMRTYIGIQVGDPVTGLLMTNTSGNTVNGVSIRFTASVTDAAETLTLQQPEVYLPAACTWDALAANPKSFVCNFGQVKNGDSIPAFTVFYVAPQKVCQSTACDTGDDVLGSDVINTQLQVLYSEGLNGPPTVWDNSNQSIAQPALLALGTRNPVKVKSAVPKGGAKVFTGSAGVPVPESLGGANSQFAESLTVPALTADAYTVAEMNIYKMTDAGAPTVTPTNVADCINNGRFVSCPVFETSVADPATLAETRFLDPTNPLRIVYRVDASNLKLSAPKILNSAVILYSGKKFDSNGNVVGTWSDQPLQMCLIKDRVNPPEFQGLPCINGSKCYKRNDTGGIPDLEGDCEWEILNTANGYGKIQ